MNQNKQGTGMDIVRRKLRGGPQDGATVEWSAPSTDVAAYRDQWAVPGDELYGVIDVYRVSDCGFFYDHIEVIHHDELELVNTNEQGGAT